MPAFDVHQPFTRAQAMADGWDPSGSAQYVSVFPGIYVPAASTITPQLRARAALAGFAPDAFLSHASAARMLGVPVPALPDEHVTVLRAGDRRRPRGVLSHVMTDPRIRLVEGTRCSAPDQLFVELATMLPLVDLVVAGDHLVRRGLVTCEQLVAGSPVSGMRGTRTARRAATYVRPLVDSPMESRLRMLLELAAFPEPRVNMTIRTRDGTPLRRYDLSWPEVRVIVEYDGRHHVERVAQWEADLDRREAIDDDGWRIIVVTARGIYAEPERTLQRVHRVLRARHLPGLPSRPDQAWRAHFPAHG